MSNVADDTRQRLLVAAGEVFAEKGFSAATVREICGRAGANLAAVNYHFGDKECLYVEAVRYAHHSGREHRSPDWPEGIPPEQKLRRYINMMLTHLLDTRRPAWHARLMAREMAEPTRACEALVESYIRQDFELLGKILAELLPPDTPAADRHLIGFSIVGQCLHFKIHQPIAALLVGEQELHTYDVDRLTDHITRFTLAALGRATPATASGDAGTQDSVQLSNTSGSEARASVSEATPATSRETDTMAQRS